ncbi:MAG TPA: sterol desaturase family protein [Candidatus Dormibacteraeota bacterium]|nr:sterol desaturase family protein [Candidatus Dormibacteraeota bacterium]
MESSNADVRRTDALRASPRMFENDLLDKLSRVHPVVPVLIFLPVIVALIVLSITGGMTWWHILVAMAGGYAFWTLCEYWIHRVIFHFEPEEGFGARLHWIIHGVHHDHPNDPMRLVMPPSVSVPLSVLFFLLFVAVVGTPTAYAVGAGFWIGYLVYDEIHYHLHHHTPTTRMGKLLRELHMRHHFQDDTRGFGISAPYWDTVFRTPLRRRSER